MTDDFHLFPDSSGGNGQIEADIALITAYLARELSPLQIVAVEERLNTDEEFRENVRPIIKGWLVPGAFGVATASRSPVDVAGPLTPEEIETGWQRFVVDTGHRTGTMPTAFGATMSATPKLGSTTQHTHRRTSMKRIAAMIGVAALPMISLAQAVSYAANHADAPGHAVASRLAALWTPESQAVRPRPPIVIASVGQDSPRVTELTGSSRGSQSTAIQAAPGVATVRGAPPDRAKIADLVKQHHPGVARGDTAVEYVVMVLDASDKYLWSTYGSGNLSIEVAGDPRTPSERRAYVQDHRAELMGDAFNLASVEPHLTATNPHGSLTPAQVQSSILAGRAVLHGTASADSARGRLAVTWHPIVGDSFFLPERRTAIGANGAVGDGGRGAGGARGSGAGGSGVVLHDTSSHLAGVLHATRLVGDSVHLFLRGDSSWTATGATRDFRRLPGTVYTDHSGATTITGGGARGGRGGGGGATAAPDDKAGVYKAGWSGTSNGPLSNQAYGLSEPIPGQSGIQGIPSAWVAAGDVYHFVGKELAPQPLSVMVVHLTPGANWKPRTP